MRNSFIILLLAASNLMAMALNAQNYQSVRSDRLSFYKSIESSVVRAARIDSVEIAGTDSILHLFNSIRQIEYDCYDIESPPWLGKSIIIKPDGTNLFFNRNNDTIMIKTQGAWVGYQWTCFTESNGNWVKAVIESIEEESFLSVSDTVKTIRFLYFDSNNQPINSGVHNKSIKISKNYGLVQALPFYVFPKINYGDTFGSEPMIEYELVGIDNYIGINNFTYPDFFDYEVGDEFHTYKYERAGFSYTFVTKEIRIVLDRTDYDQDSIIYLISRCYVQTRQHGSNPVFTIKYNDTIVQKVNLQNETLNELYLRLPQETYISYSGTYQHCAQYLHMAYGYNGRYAKVKKPSFIRVCLQGNCYTPTLWDACAASDFYYEGLGGPYGGCYSWNTNTELIRRLEYFKKGDEIWGEPYYCDVLLGGQDLPHTEHDVIEVYPNPAENFISVKLKEYPADVLITDLAGRLQLHQMLNAANQQIDISSLPKGFYIGLVHSKDRFVGSMKFIRE